jgi:DNA-directed RNA polymerase subunit M
MSMSFCKKCGSLMIPQKKDKKIKLICPNCGFAKSSNEKETKLEEENKEKEKIEVVNEKDLESSTATKVKAECPKCHNDEAYYWIQQTRASDEPETKFFRCTKCKHTWRDYS